MDNKENGIFFILNGIWYAIPKAMAKIIDPRSIGLSYTEARKKTMEEGNERQ